MGILVGDWYPITKVEGIDIGYSDKVVTSLSRYITCDTLACGDTNHADDPAYLVISRIIDTCTRYGIPMRRIGYTPMETLELLFDFVWKNPVLIYEGEGRGTRIALWQCAFDDPDSMKTHYPEMYTDKVVEGMKEVIRIINHTSDAYALDEDTENIIRETLASESPYLEKYVLHAILERLELNPVSIGAKVAVVENGYCYLNPDRIAEAIIREAKNACD